MKTCEHCGKSFRPRKPSRRFCCLTCSNKGKVRSQKYGSEISKQVSDDMVWRRRNLSLGEIARWAPQDYTVNSVGVNLNRRGWRFTYGGSQHPSYVEAAPCKLCGRKAVPMSQLNDKRECRTCKPLFGGMVARISDALDASVRRVA